MPGLEYLLPFALASLAIAFTPGPAILYTAARTLAGGRRAGFMAALGIHLGGFLHVLAATLGLSAIFQLVPQAFFALKIAGALYLVWLGLQMLLSRTSGGALPQVQAMSAHRAFVQSVIVEILNPKVAIFFIAFLPQFVSPESSFPLWLQFLLLGALANAAFSSVDLLTVLTTERMVLLARGQDWLQRAMKWLSGSILIGLGVRLALEER